jgi:hypothetical protein
MSYESKYEGRQGFRQALTIYVKRLELIALLNSNCDGIKIPNNWTYITSFLPVSNLYKLSKPPPGAMMFKIPKEVAVSQGLELV